MTVSPTKKGISFSLLHGVHLVDAAEDTRHLLWTKRRGNHLAAVLLGIAEKSQHIGSVTIIMGICSYESGLDQHITG